MSTLTDQKLRQELTKFGETVPPITQRNREQLRARLELLQSSKSRRSNSNSRTPSRTRSQSKPTTPSRARTPVKSTTPSRISTRSKGVATPTKPLIELSDSDIESSRTIQTRSSRRQNESNLINSVTEDVEQSSKIFLF